MITDGKGSYQRRRSHEPRRSRKRSHRSEEEQTMNNRFNKRSLSETDTVRSEDFWHSVWKLIEVSPGDDAPLAKREAPLQAPRDYVLDTDSYSVNGRA